MTKPIKKFNAGLVQVAVWENEGKEGRKYNTISIVRRYKTENDEWKSSNSLTVNDLPRAVLALNKAFEFIALKQPSEFIQANEIDDSL